MVNVTRFHVVVVGVDDGDGIIVGFTVVAEIGVIAGAVGIGMSGGGVVDVDC